ncbi:proline dehydrogenase family protein [Oceanobacillus halophilus]|uniref:proline dehydrogenase n=1 Tax=Oceanobacillus halophilus TaxID=930130 RepID=A0A494ZZC2_9BACI|nr:proline dehydrogenase family protein [Oceanobacillus halophilus]RKQ30509.1 proline dehydrogenase [Oceanobacillus halophilus]
MTNFTRDFFIGLSNNKFLNEHARRWGFRFGADKFVAGTTIEDVIHTIRKLNMWGISCTIDNLGEFVSEKAEALKAKEQIIAILEAIYNENLDCHLSVKLTQLGLDIEQEFCVDNMREILDKARQYDVFVNIDMEDYAHYIQTLDVLKALRAKYDNVGTVIQSYLYRTEDDLEELKNVRLRLVKGAYKEREEIAYQTKEEIDREYILIAKKRLLGDAFTSLATHDHHIINELLHFIRENNISKDKFEFQMLYGFRREMQYDIAQKGYNFCTYIPFGNDWFGYFMRRLAERPQNMNLVMKDVFYSKDNQLKKEPIITGAVAFSLVMLWRARRKVRKEEVR